MVDLVTKRTPQGRLTYDVNTRMVDNMESGTKKTEFGIMLRDLRVSKGLKQREVAVGAGISTSTVGNAESAPHRVMGRDAVLRLTYFFGLDRASSDSLIELWEKTPLSEFSQKQKGIWEKRNALRNKAKNHDKLKLALVELLGLHLMSVPDAEVCACDFGATCGVCAALERVGLDPFTPADRDKILAKLTKIRDDLTQPKPTPSAHDTNSLAQ